MKRDAELQGEIKDIQDALNKMVGDDFTIQLTKSQMQRRISSLEDELLAASNRKFEFRFVDREDPTSHGISTSLLSKFLSRIQSTITYGAWAMVAGSEVAGNVPASIERSAMTEVVAMPSGSFGLVLQKVNNDFSTEFDQSVDLIIDLVDAAISERLNDEIGEKVQSLGRESTRRLQLFVKRIAQEGLDAELTWSNPNGKRTSYLSGPAASELSAWLSQMSPEIVIEVVQGYLRRADTINGSFKIESRATSAMYEGKGDAAVLAHAEMDALYMAEIEIVKYSSLLTSRTVEKTRLIGLVQVTSS